MIKPSRRRALYEQVADRIEPLIRSGTLRPGERIPSIRRTSVQQSVSTTTAVQAYLELENRGLIEARPKSGFYVRTMFRDKAPEPEKSRPPNDVTAVTVRHLESRLFATARLSGIVRLGVAEPGPELLPTAKLNRILASLTRSAGKRGVAYDLPPEGAAPLRRAIARRLLDAGVSLSAADIITTSGATEALMLCLRAVTRPGDIVAVESPTFFGVLATLEDLHLRAIEIPTEPRDGFDLDALERILKRRRVTACVAMPNFNNPLGSLMPDENKRRLAELLSKREIPLIEDDVFGELPFGAERPRVVRSFDRNGFALLCGSFSKTLAPGYRAGWVAPGPRYLETIKMLKLTSTLSAATLPQLAVAEFLATGGYDHHLRSLRQKFAAQVNRMSTAIAAAFPPATKITRPGGGFVLWIQLPERVCALKLDDMALAAGVSIAPGPMFSATHGFGNFIRISCCHAWSLKTDHAIDALASLVRHLS